MDNEKPVEYFAEFTISIKEKGGNSNSYAQEIFRQRVNLEYIHQNPRLIPQVIAVINKLEVPNG